MASFTVKGPFDVPAPKHAVARHISAEEGKQFWGEHPDLADECGCYLFAFRASQGYKPIYVGKATKSFSQEVFASHKLDKYNQGLVSIKKGTPVLFFVSLDKTRGRINESAIDEVESFLIQSGIVANKSLLNSRKTKVESWSISGVVRAGAGQPSDAAKELCQCLKL
ncbi:MAG: hypothetical protein FWD77_12000 [Betaproteobacteria bacterium]|nr:hypothetical protein [Betaproteobacteria bacterium]